MQPMSRRGKRRPSFLKVYLNERRSDKYFARINFAHITFDISLLITQKHALAACFDSRQINDWMLPMVQDPSEGHGAQ
jgi:hypothetical protein